MVLDVRRARMLSENLSGLVLNSAGPRAGIPAADISVESWEELVRGLLASNFSSCPPSSD